MLTALATTSGFIATVGVLASAALYRAGSLLLVLDVALVSLALADELALFTAEVGALAEAGATTELTEAVLALEAGVAGPDACDAALAAWLTVVAGVVSACAAWGWTSNKKLAVAKTTPERVVTFFTFRAKLAW